MGLVVYLKSLSAPYHITNEVIVMKIIRVVKAEGFFHTLREGSLLVASRVLEKIFDVFNLWPEE